MFDPRKLIPLSIEFWSAPIAVITEMMENTPMVMPVIVRAARNLFAPSELQRHAHNFAKQHGSDSELVAMARVLHVRIESITPTLHPSSAPTHTEAPSPDRGAKPTMRVRNPRPVPSTPIQACSRGPARTKNGSEKTERRYQSESTSRKRRSARSIPPSRQSAVDSIKN